MNKSESICKHVKSLLDSQARGTAGGILDGYHNPGGDSIGAQPSGTLKDLSSSYPGSLLKTTLPL